MNKELLDIAIERLESLRDKGLERVHIDTTDGRDGEFNLNTDIDFYEKPKPVAEEQSNE